RVGRAGALWHDPAPAARAADTHQVRPARPRPKQRTDLAARGGGRPQDQREESRQTVRLIRAELFGLERRCRKTSKAGGGMGVRAARPGSPAERNPGGRGCGDRARNKFRIRLVLGSAVAIAVAATASPDVSFVLLFVATLTVAYCGFSHH